MKLQNTFTIPVPAREAWKVLLDIERIAPCVPGAGLVSNDGDAFHGRVKVKLGPIALTYSGTITFVSRDEDAYVAVMEASGRENRGGGTAKAIVTCTLVEHGDVTEVLVDTDLAITGKPAQFGRSALADVATALIDQFAINLAAELGTRPVATDSPAQPIDLLATAGGGTPRRVGGVLAAAAALLLVVLGLRRRRSTKSTPS